MSALFFWNQLEYARSQTAPTVGQFGNSEFRDGNSSEIRLVRFGYWLPDGKQFGDPSTRGGGNRGREPVD